MSVAAESLMLEADYLRQQAEACSNLSRTTFDLSLAGRLRAMADELRRKAAEIERGGFEESRTDHTPMPNRGVKRN